MTRYTPVLFAVVFSVSAFAAEIVPNHDGLVVHEWGTFTSVAGETGEAVAWSPLASAPDLPCFVNRLSPQNPKAAMATVRMETPVLYFYPQRDMTLSVHVAFPQGWITEWYPKATHVTPQPSSSLIFGDYRGGKISWDDLQVTPGQAAEFPRGQEPSRYYAARNTDATPLTIAGQHEKMIFYRGIGNFAIPLRAAYDKQGALEITNTGGDTVPMAMLFENHEGKVGYRVVRDLKDRARVQPVELTGSLAEARSTLAAVLVENRLFPKEAAAMIETWHDSWFEAGARVIYIVPRRMVDAVLPLNVTPAATSTSRVFVGRVEVLSPAVRNTLQTAIAKGDSAALAKFDRFLEPFVARIGKQGSEVVNRARGTVWESLASVCVK